ncbi:MAG TPA: L,D-transpeptidase family protein [Xanthobacteraceae bacterium]|nr:L,D-transpeptidase family protein [Xanthobacteraceae bacterium]
MFGRSGSRFLTTTALVALMAMAAGVNAPRAEDAGAVETTDNAGMGTGDAGMAAVPAPAAPTPEAPAIVAVPESAVPEPVPVAAEPESAPAVAATPEPAPAPAAVAAPVVVDGVAERLAVLLGPVEIAKFTSLKSEQEALVAFYSARANAPLFTADSAISATGRAVLGTLEAAADEGLAPSDYAVAVLPADAADAAVAQTELRIAAAALLYARHVQAGRFDPTRISAAVTPERTLPEPAAVLAALAQAGDPRAVLAAYAPQYPGYQALRGKLAGLRAEAGAVAPVAVPPGRVLRPGMSDARVPLLRVRLGVTGPADSLSYDHDLVEAVKQFQTKIGQPSNGVVGAGVVAALNDNGERRLADVIANMERWRWLPHDVASRYVFVNIPEFLVRIVKDGSVIHQTKVVVGKPDSPTPLLSHDMEYVVFNPYWNVPPGIARNEMLPKLAANPYALAEQGIEVVRNGKAVDPGSIDWSRGTRGYSFRQPPGERNALGRIKFMFPNKHSVYLHDTPSRALFANERRAYSHGCVRVFEPLKFGEVIFSLGMPDDPWSQQRISKQLGGKERYVNLKQRFPVHIAYFTTFVNDAGDLVTREDLYGINAQTRLMLGLDGARRVADGGVVRPRP